MGIYVKNARENEREMHESDAEEYARSQVSWGDAVLSRILHGLQLPLCSVFQLSHSGDVILEGKADEVTVSMLAHGHKAQRPLLE